MYVANVMWPKGSVSYRTRADKYEFDTYEGAEDFCRDLEANGLNGDGKTFPEATWVTFVLKDYSEHYCPICLHRLPRNGEHWDSCGNYEADRANPRKYFALNKKEAYERRLERTKEALKRVNKSIRTLKALKAEEEEVLRNL